MLQTGDRLYREIVGSLWDTGAGLIAGNVLGRRR